MVEMILEMGGVSYLLSLISVAIAIILVFIVIITVLITIIMRWFILMAVLMMIVAFHAELMVCFEAMAIALEGHLPT